MAMPKISIIIPAYNEEKYIEKTLHSVKKQTMPDYEVIVVANGCTDKTEEILKKNNDAKMRHLSLPKANVSVARNAGALNAQATVLLFLDADTQLDNNALELMLQHFDKQHSVATTKARPDLPSWKYSLALGLKNIYNQTHLYQGCSGALLCRKEDFHSVGGYNPEIAVREHRKLILKLRQQGKYHCLPTTVTTSMRRYQQWGLGKLLWFWTKQWVNDQRGELKGKEYEVVR